MNIWEDLKFRGLINQVTDGAGLEKSSQKEQVSM